jgi:hypothetical protein
MSKRHFFTEKARHPFSDADPDCHSYFSLSYALVMARTLKSGRKWSNDLLKYGCDAKETVQGQRPGRTVDALSMYLFSTEGHDWSVITEPFMAVCRLLLPKGSNPNGRRCTGSESSLPMFTLNRGSFKYKGSWRRESHRPSRTYEWCPIIHDIGLLPVDHEHLSTLFNEFITSRVDLNAEDSKGTTLLELLFRKHVYLSLEGWLQLLENGAKVTRAMVEFRREENASDERSGLYSTKYDNHPLRHPQCREARFIIGGPKR